MSTPKVTDYTLQLLHYYGESGMLGVQTAPIMGAMIDRFDDQYANTLVLGEGDSFIPGPWLVAGADPSLSTVAGIGSTALGRPDIAIMNAFGTDASALGNHEFDLGSPVLQGAIAASGSWVGAQFPLLTANLSFSADSSLRGLADASLGGTASNAFAGQEAAAIKGKIAPYAVVTEGGQKIGLIGITTFDLLIKSSPNGTVPKDDGNPATSDIQEVAIYVQAAVDALKALGVNKIVMVDQLDTVDRNKALAPLVSGVDVMIAGGGHERMGDANDSAAAFPGHDASFIADAYPIVAAGADGKPTLIVTTDTEYSYLGRLVVDFDANGDIIVDNLSTALNGAYAATEATLQAAYGSAASGASLVAASSIGSKVQAIVSGIDTVVATKDSVIYGYTKVYLEGDRVYGRAQEVNLGNVTADANRDAAAKALPSQPFIASLKNGGGLRASIGSIDEDGGKVPPAATGVKPNGGISKLDIENALRFDNKLMVFDTTPQGLKNILEYGVTLPAGNGGFAQLGGVRVSFDPDNAAGNKVVNISLVNADGQVVARVFENGKASPSAPATLSMVALNFNANGGDGYPIKANADNFRYLLTDGTLSAAVDESLDFTTAATMQTVGQSLATVLGEQKAFQDYLLSKHATPDTAISLADTPASADLRIENLNVRLADGVFEGSTITGGTGNDTLNPTAGSDLIDGGAGSDTVVYAVARADATVERTGPGAWKVATAAGGTDTLSHVEAVKFTDGTLHTTDTTPYLVSEQPNVRFVSLLTVGDVAGTKVDGTTPWKMVGIPDGLGAFDNGDGTVTVLMNHEIGAATGVVRDSGATGSFVSRLVIDKATLSVISGSDEDQQVYLWNSALNAGTGGYELSTTALARLCSADLAPVSAFFNAATGLGTQDRIFLNGEESGTEGRPMAHIATGADQGKAYELPVLGNSSWENLLANPNTGDKTVLIGTDDSTPGQIYFYIGTKQASGTTLEKAGLTNGTLYGIKADFRTEANSGTPLSGGFTLAALPNETNRTGADLQADSNAAGVTEWLRPEDGAWDTQNPNRFYFVTTNALNSPSRLWALDFVDAKDPSKGGTYTALLDGTEGQKMFDNITVSADGTLILQEDVGNTARSGKVWYYNPKTDALTEIAQHDVARFGNETTPATAPFNQDEEASGIIDVTGLFGNATTKAFLLTTQAHNSLGGELVEGGQLQLMYIDTAMTGTAGSDTLTGSFVSESIDGGAGKDTVVLAGNKADATILQTGLGSWTVTTATGGTDTLTHVETLKFADATVNAGIDLSTYIRVGRYDLPEPTRTTAPTHSLLAQEVSAVTYNPDTDTLFVLGDGGTSIVQVSKTGQLIDSMTLAPGGSPQGTTFYDPEGLTYIGNGQFVMTEERDRNAVKFNYAAGTTLTRADAQTVALGTNVGNVGLEGVTYDPETGGFIFVKETSPEGIFQTSIDFAAGTASNGSATTVNSVNLFDPALAKLLDFADVYALSNLAPLAGLDESSHLLVLSQESGKIVNVDRAGNVSSSLTIQSDPGNPLSVVNQQHEGLTMDGAGNLYVVSENGGGDFDHPQLWVYAPSQVPNKAPTGLALTNPVSSIEENTSTTARLKVADIALTDDGIGTNTFSLSGADAAFFDADSTGLYIKGGTVLDYETKASYAVTVNVADSSVGGSVPASTSFTLSLTNVVNENPNQAVLFISEVAPWSSGNSPVAADWFEVTNSGSSAVDLAGWKFDDNSNLFTQAVPMSGIASIAPGESVIFIETADLAAAKTAFINTWFGGTAPAGLQIGSYSGSGVGLSTGGDAVNLFNAAGVLQANVTFGASSANAPYPTFNNAAGANNTSITALSAVGKNGAFVAANDPKEIGSPGTVGKLFISEAAPWSSGNSPVAADWFEVTNTTAKAIDVTGWRMDDNSGSPAAAVALNGITSIAPGESVIFIETADLAAAKTAFINTWFGGTAPAGLQIGSYSGSGVGLGTGGDAVNLYDITNTLRASLAFGTSPTGTFKTFDNAAGLTGGTTNNLSAAGTNGAFVAAGDAAEIGSPGRIVTPANQAPTGTVSIAGTATQGETLTASNTLADADGLGAITYHWLRDGTDTGATGATYTITQADVGKAISVKASYTDALGTAETATSTATAAVANVNDAPTGTVAITGTATQGETLTASNTLADADGLGAISYRWLRNGVDTGVIGATFLLTQADVGKAISAKASYTDALGTAETATSAATAAVANVNDAPTLAHAIAVQSAMENQAFRFTVPAATFADVDTGDSLTYGATLASGGSLPSWLAFDASTRTFSGRPGFDDSGLLSLQLTATDNHGASASTLLSLAVTDAVLPKGARLAAANGGGLTGGQKANVLVGQGGNDRLNGGGGNDQLFGGAGADKLKGGTGNDTVDGGTGADKLYGESGRDILIGGAGNDLLNGGVGRDVYRYTSGVLGFGDLGGGDHDIIRATKGDTITFDAEVWAHLTKNGAALGTLAGQALASQIDANNSIAQVGRTIQIDVNGDGAFQAGQDFSIQILGQAHHATIDNGGQYLLLG